VVNSISHRAHAQVGTQSSHRSVDTAHAALALYAARQQSPRDSCRLLYNTLPPRASDPSIRAQSGSGRMVPSDRGSAGGDHWTLSLAAEVGFEQGLAAKRASDETIRVTLMRLGMR